MTLKTKIILTFLNIIFVSIDIKPKCSCIEKQINNIENIIYYNNLEINYFNNKLYEFETLITREKILLDKWECKYNNFENYINSINSENKIISAKYRFLRWLHITNKKLIGYKRRLDTELKQISYEFELVDFRKNINYFNNLQDTLANQIEIKCNNILIEDIKALSNKINQTTNLFDHLIKESSELINQSIQFKSRIKELICSRELESCCCWY